MNVTAVLETFQLAQFSSNYHEAVERDAQESGDKVYDETFPHQDETLRQRETNYEQMTGVYFDAENQASSSNYTPYQVDELSDERVRSELQPYHPQELAYEEPQVPNCSYLTN